MADRFNLSDVMISYSRRDKDFVEKLERAIRKTGREIWIDWEDIPPTVDWWEEIKAGIEAAHTIVFVVSPDSVHSEVCYREIAHAVDMNKRIVPVLRREVPKEDILNPNIMHPSVASHNWIMFRESDDQRKAFMTLLKSLETDIRHVNQHTRLLVRATDWDEKGRPNSLLLRGDDLRHAENWLAESGGAGVSPTQLQIEYITLSRRAAIRTTQTITTIAMTGLAVFIALMIFGALQFRGRVEARAQEAEALITAQVAFGNAETALFEQAAAEQRATDAAFSVQTADALSFIARSGQGRAEVAATEAFFAESTANANQATAVANLGTADARALTANNAQSTSVALQSAAEQGQSEAEAAAATADSAEGTAIAQQLTAEFQATVASAAEQTAIAERSTQQARADAEGTSAALAGIEANQQGTAAAQQQAEANRQSTEAANQRNEADRQREAADEAQADAERERQNAEEAAQRAAAEEAEANRQRQIAEDERQAAEEAADRAATEEARANRAAEEAGRLDERNASLELLEAARDRYAVGSPDEAMNLALLAVDGDLEFPISQQVEAEFRDVIASFAVREELYVGSVFAVSWAPDGRHLALNSVRSDIVIVDTHTMQITGFNYQHDFADYDLDLGDIWSDTDNFQWSPVNGENRVMVSAEVRDTKGTSTGADDDYKHIIFIVDTTTGNVIQVIDINSPSEFSFEWSPDGQYVAVTLDPVFGGASDHSIYIYDVNSGQRIAQLGTTNNADATIGHTGYPTDVSWAPDSIRLASVSHDGTVRIWNALSGTLLYPHYVNIQADTVDWRANDEQIVTAFADPNQPRSYVNIIQVDPPWGVVQSIQTNWAVLSAEWSDMSTNHRIFIHGHGKSTIWDPETGAQDTSLSVRMETTTYGASVSPGGDRVAVAGFPGFRILDVPTISGSWSAENLSSGPVIAGLGETQVTIHDSITSGILWQTLCPRSSSTDSIKEIVQSPDRQWLATRSSGAVDFWQLNNTSSRDSSGACNDSGYYAHRFTFAPSSLDFIRWSPDSNRLAVGGNSASNTRLFNVDSASGTVIESLVLNGSLRDVAWSPDSTLIAGGSGGFNDNNREFTIWDVSGQTAQPVVTSDNIGTLKTDVFGFISAIAWSADGKYLVAGTNTSFVREADIALFVWSWDDGTRALTFERTMLGHTSNLKNISFNPAPGSQHLLASLSADNSFRMWDVRSGIESINRSIQTDFNIRGQITWRSDGSEVIVATGESVIQLPAGNLQQLIDWACGNRSIAPLDTNEAAFHNTGNRSYDCSQRGTTDPIPPRGISDFYVPPITTINVSGSTVSVAGIQVASAEEAVVEQAVAAAAAVVALPTETAKPLPSGHVDFAPVSGTWQVLPDGGGFAASGTETAILQSTTPLDLTGYTSPQLRFNTLHTAGAGSGMVNVMLPDGSNVWQTVELIIADGEYTVPLGGYMSNALQIQVAWLPDASMDNAWQVAELRVEDEQTTPTVTAPPTLTYTATVTTMPAATVTLTTTATQLPPATTTSVPTVTTTVQASVTPSQTPTSPASTATVPTATLLPVTEGQPTVPSITPLPPTAATPTEATVTVVPEATVQSELTATPVVDSNGIDAEGNQN